MPDWSTTFEAIRTDHARLRTRLAAEMPPNRSWIPAGLVAVVLYRLGRHLHIAGWRIPARMIWLANLLLTGADIDSAAQIGKGLVIRYPRSCAIYGNVGENCTFFARSGIGGLLRASMADIGAGKGKPVLGADVELGPGALVLGPVRIGRGVRIGVYCCVIKDTPAGAVISPDSVCGGCADGPLPRTMRGWREMRRALGADRARLREYYAQVQDRDEILWLQPAYLAVVLYRLGHMLHGFGLRGGARMLWRLNVILTGADLDPGAEIGAGVLMPSPAGVFCRGHIGEGCTLNTQVAVGWPVWPVSSQHPGTRVAPVVGQAVDVGPGALIIGPVRVGNGARIGPRCVVLGDVSDGAKLAPQRWRSARTLPSSRTDSGSLRGTLRLMRSDLDRTVAECTQGRGARGLRFAAHVFVPSAAAALLFRLSHWAFCNDLRLLAGSIAYVNQRIFGVFIHPASRIGPELFIPHTSGVTICASAGMKLSAYPLCVITPKVLPGWRGDLPADAPVLGEGARVGTHAVILGKVVVGDDAVIGAGAVIERDVPSGAVVMSRRNARAHWPSAAREPIA